MQTTPQANQLTIAVFGEPNVGKSALINALAGRVAAEVSPHPGTTVEPGYITTDMLPVGRATLIDTVGFREKGKLNERYLETMSWILGQADVVLLILDATRTEMTTAEHRFLATVAPRELPLIAAFNKADLVKKDELRARIDAAPYPAIATSAQTGEGIGDLRFLLREIRPDGASEKLVSDLVSEGDIVVMIVPQESQAPTGRLSALHSQLVRETLDAGSLPMVVRETELPLAMTALTRAPALVVADTTNFDRMTRLVPPDIPLTSLSLLAARRKGNLGEFISAVRSIARLRPGDRVLIAEGCSHRPYHEEAENERIPVLLQTLAGGPLRIDRVRGDAFADSLRGYSLVAHCDACVLSRKEMIRRQAIGKRDGVPVITYAVLSTYINHALSRALAPLRRNGAPEPETYGLAEITDPDNSRAAATVRTAQME